MNFIVLLLISVFLFLFVIPVLLLPFICEALWSTLLFLNVLYK